MKTAPKTSVRTRKTTQINYATQTVKPKTKKSAPSPQSASHLKSKKIHHHTRAVNKRLEKPQDKKISTISSRKTKKAQKSVISAENEAQKYSKVSQVAQRQQKVQKPEELEKQQQKRLSTGIKKQRKELVVKKCPPNDNSIGNTTGVNYNQKSEQKFNENSDNNQIENKREQKQDKKEGPRQKIERKGSENIEATYMGKCQEDIFDVLKPFEEIQNKIDYFRQSDPEYWQLIQMSKKVETKSDRH